FLLIQVSPQRNPGFAIQYRGEFGGNLFADEPHGPEVGGVAGNAYCAVVVGFDFGNGDYRTVYGIPNLAWEFQNITFAAIRGEHVWRMGVARSRLSTVEGEVAGLSHNSACALLFQQQTPLSGSVFDWNVNK
ncbi:hypothetical protein PSPO01_16602, partial [Paraphaeosphaeria sporulosa]